MNNEKQYIASNQIIEHYKSQIILQKIQIFKPFFTKHTQLYLQFVGEENLGHVQFLYTSILQ